MNKAVLLSLIVPVIYLILSCNPVYKYNDINSGTIEYSIRYLNEDLEHKEESLLPKSMELVFNQDHAVNYIDGFLGLYKLNSITNFESRKCSTILKVFDKHYLYQGKKGEFMCCFDQMEDMEINETGDTKIIAGLLCKRAIVSLPSRNESFNIYYTKDIDLRHPNQNNPYKKIDGVLIQFELRLLHLRMEFVAEKFIQQTSIKSDLTFPLNTTEITRDQMTQILSKLME